MQIDTVVGFYAVEYEQGSSPLTPKLEVQLQHTLTGSCLGNSYQIFQIKVLRYRSEIEENVVIQMKNVTLDFSVMKCALREIQEKESV